MVDDQYDFIFLSSLLDKAWERQNILKLDKEAELVYALNLAAYTRSYMQYEIQDPD